MWKYGISHPIFSSYCRNLSWVDNDEADEGKQSSEAAKVDGDRCVGGKDEIMGGKFERAGGDEDEREINIEISKLTLNLGIVLKTYL